MAEAIVVSAPEGYPRGLSDYLNDIAERESNNTPTAVNRFGYLGKYQFSPRTLWGLGDEFKVTKDEFLRNEILQDSAMVAYLRHNHTILDDIIEKFEYRMFNGIYVTRSGILAGAHLIGPYGIKAYFDPSFKLRRGDRWIRPRIEDGNGTHVSEYVEKFSQYDIDEALN
jgi:hypothetical protein